METQKTILLAALFFLSYMVWQGWVDTFPDKHKDKTSIEEPKEESGKQSINIVPDVQSGSNYNNQNESELNNNLSSVSDVNNVASKTVNNLITISTDVVEYKINPIGGDIVQVKLLKYNNSLDDSNAMQLLNQDVDSLYIAPNGLTGTNGPDNQDSRAIYKTEKTNYELSEGQQKLKVDFILNKDNVKITKSFILKSGEYDIDVQYNILNNSGAPWVGNVFSVLKRKNIEKKSSMFLVPVGYTGLAAYNQDDKFHKITPDSLTSSQQNWTTTEGWAAMVQHYFISSWIPDSKDSYKYIARSNPDGTYMVTLVGPDIVVRPGNETTKSIKFYAGPEQAERLKKLATGLDRTVDYGIMWFVASAIFWAMKKIYSIVGNWGWAIILVTVFIKMLFYKLASSSYRSMAKLRVLTPKIEQLRKRHGEDREKVGKAMMELYKKEKVNPLGGCLPMLIQLPFFIALYWVIIESVELRQAPFVWWIQDLSVKDPFFILPILMGLAMLGQQKLSPAPADPSQAKVMMMMPLIFTGMFMYFPAGLVLYWVVNTVTSIMQQWYITKTVESERQQEIDAKKKVKSKFDNKNMKAVNDNSFR